MLGIAPEALALDADVVFRSFIDEDTVADGMVFPVTFQRLVPPPEGIGVAQQSWQVLVLL
jgi:hypothetical protein